MPSMEELRKKSIWDLKRYLKERDEVCPGCITKEHYLARVVETWKKFIVKPQNGTQAHVLSYVLIVLCSPAKAGGP
jgi:hypothetical protein